MGFGCGLEVRGEGVREGKPRRKVWLLEERTGTQHQVMGRC